MKEGTEMMTPEEQALIDWIRLTELPMGEVYEAIRQYQAKYEAEVPPEPKETPQFATPW